MFISILFKVIFCETGNLLTTSQSDTKVSNCFFVIASKSLITVLTIPGTLFFVVKFIEVILNKWIHCNAFDQSINIGRESFVKKLVIFMVLGSLFGKNLILIYTIFELKYYSIRAISELQVSQRIRAGLLTFLSKPLALPHPFISLLPSLWMWSKNSF